jgi:hypothetical protein
MSPSLNCIAGIRVWVSHIHNKIPPKTHLQKAIGNERNQSVPALKTRSLPFTPPKTPARKNMTQYVSAFLRGAGGGGGEVFREETTGKWWGMGCDGHQTRVLGPNKDTHHDILLPFSYPAHI